MTDKQQFCGILVLDDEEFSEFEKTVMVERPEPTESIKRGAELIKRLYGHRAERE
jgi:hypothetical protein